MNPPGFSYPWYAIVSGIEIQQGDILADCPVFSPPESIEPEGMWEVARTRRDVIIMTQSCDLQAYREQPTEVLLCGIYQRSQIPDGHRLANADALEHVRKGNMPAFYLLAASDLDIKRELTVVDFRRVYSLSFDFVRRHSAHSLHLRLLPPYREQLS